LGGGVLFDYTFSEKRLDGPSRRGLEAEERFAWMGEEDNGELRGTNKALSD